MAFTVPEPIRKFFSLFPLHTWPEEARTKLSPQQPTLWVLPPKNQTEATSVFSSDVECLKWQAYLILRGISDYNIRYDISEEAGVDGHLPTLQLPTGELLGTQKLLLWVHANQPTPLDELEGYQDQAARDESRAWVALLEGVIHAGLIHANPKERTLSSFIHNPPRLSLASVLQPPAAPISGYTTPFPTKGIFVPTSTVNLQFREAIEALSDRLGSDEWFLGSKLPTALDALAFAYIHCAMDSPTSLKRVVERRGNLVAWERKVQEILLAKSPNIVMSPQEGS